MEAVAIAGVGWGISILGWVISPVLSKLVNKGLDYLGDVTGSWAKNLKNLEEKVLHLKLMFEAAQGSPDAEEKSQRWLKKLKSAFYDAEEILDAIDYHRLKFKATSHRYSVKTTKEKAIAKEDFRFPPGSKDNLRKTLEEIEKLFVEAEKLLPLLRLTTSGDNIKSSPEQTTGLGSLSKTTSEPPENVFGRHEVTEKIRSMLHDDKKADHFAIVIHGFAGTGKTTLAQHVCDSEKKFAQHDCESEKKFNLFMWIHVTKNFSVHTVYKEMLEIARGQEKTAKEPSKEKTADVNFSNLDMLQSELKEKLKGKKLLLVLDDVWYSASVAEQDNVKKLLSPLKAADKGSRALVTSRTTEAANLLGGAYHLEQISDMDEEEFSKMFMHYALDNSLVTDQAPASKFETVGNEIATLLRGSPLAARTVAGQLRRKHLSFWIDTLNRKSDLLKDTRGALWWSYHQLEEHVRQCFAYCSMFPRRHELEQDKLVKMWMAQGFVDSSKSSDMEAAARECFEVLKSASFLQLKHDEFGKEYFTVHDLLHDLAERVAGSDFFRTEKGTVGHQIPLDVRHLFIDSDNLGQLMEQIVKLDTLRTLVMSGSAKEITEKEFQRILKYLKKLRFVSVGLKEFGGNVIPECISELKHLRYLGIIAGFPYATIDLPSTFTKLYHLQEIAIPSALQVRCLDSDHIADLENLRHIPRVYLSIPDIGRMPWLQSLDGGFRVKKEKGYEITQLENMNNIRGDLIIEGLGNIQSKEDARRANLSNKLHVSSLTFDWNDYNCKAESSSSNKKRKTVVAHHQQEVTPEPEEILEALHPPALLEELTISYYDGSTFPSWLSGEDGKLKHLERLSFCDCYASGSELKFSKPLPELHSLYISGCSWNALPDKIKQMASLKVLRIKNCPNISTLPELPASLEELIILCCTNIESLPGLPSSLKILEIEVCRNINTLQELPPSLEVLQIEDCQNIQSLPGLPPSLKKLIITNCRNISTLPELPLSLEELHCKNDLLESYRHKQAFGRIKTKTW